MVDAAAFPSIRHEIAGVSIAALAEQYGTPVYAYDAATILQRVRDLQAFDVVRFAQKACSNVAILKLLREHGVVVDAVSAGEIHRAVTAGYAYHGDPHPVTYCADIFDRLALQWVVEHDIHVNCGSPDMIDQLGELAPGRNITLRINPGFGHGHSQKTNTGGEQSKHGIWHEQLNDCLQRADRYGMAVTGLHMHIGSGTDFEHLAQVCGALESAATVIGRTITTISAGGGLPTPYREGDEFVDIDRYFALWDATRTRLQEAFGHAITLEIEPGRYLAAEAGYLITRYAPSSRWGRIRFISWMQVSIIWLAPFSMARTTRCHWRRKTVLLSDHFKTSSWVVHFASPEISLHKKKVALFVLGHSPPRRSGTCWSSNAQVLTGW